MKTLIIYDSWYHNTHKIADAIATGLSGEVRIIHVRERPLTELASSAVIVVGSPTHGGVPSPAMKEFLDDLPASSMTDKLIAAFDTRVKHRLLNMIGYAGPRIAKQLTSKGGRLLAEPAGFYVHGKEGPLRDGELNRAVEWGRSLSRLAQQTHKEAVT